MEGIAAGNFGKIYKTTVKGKTYAVKKFRVLEENLTEIDIITRLDVPNVIHGELQYPLIYMELFPWSMLTAIKEKVKLSDKSLLIQQAINGLNWLHSYNILHMDIKPGNILVSGSGPSGEGPTAMIVDFGLCKYLTLGQSMHRSMSLTGSPGYIRPDLLTSKIKEYDRSTDLWALGMTAMEFLVNHEVHVKKMSDKSVALFNEDRKIFLVQSCRAEVLSNTLETLVSYDSTYPFNPEIVVQTDPGEDLDPDLEDSIVESLDHLIDIDPDTKDFFTILHLLYESYRHESLEDVDPVTRTEYIYDIGVRLNNNYTDHRSSKKSYLVGLEKFTKSLLEATGGVLRPVNLGDYIETLDDYVEIGQHAFEPLTYFSYLGSLGTPKVLSVSDSTKRWPETILDPKGLKFPKLSKVYS